MLCLTAWSFYARILQEQECTYSMPYVRGNQYGIIQSAHNILPNEICYNQCSMHLQLHNNRKLGNDRCIYVNKHVNMRIPSGSQANYGLTVTWLSSENELCVNTNLCLCFQLSRSAAETRRECNIARTYLDDPGPLGATCPAHRATGDSVLLHTYCIHKMSLPVLYSLDRLCTFITLSRSRQRLILTGNTIQEKRPIVIKVVNILVPCNCHTAHNTLVQQYDMREYRNDVYDGVIMIIGAIHGYVRTIIGKLCLSFQLPRFATETPRECSTATWYLDDPGSLGALCSARRETGDRVTTYTYSIRLINFLSVLYSLVRLYVMNARGRSCRRVVYDDNMMYSVCMPYIRGISAPITAAECSVSLFVEVIRMCRLIPSDFCRMAIIRSDMLMLESILLNDQYNDNVIEPMPYNAHHAISMLQAATSGKLTPNAICISVTIVISSLGKQKARNLLMLTAVGGWLIVNNVNFVIMMLKLLSSLLQDQSYRDRYFVHKYTTAGCLPRAFHPWVIHDLSRPTKHYTSNSCIQYCNLLPTDKGNRYSNGECSTQGPRTTVCVKRNGRDHSYRVSFVMLRSTMQYLPRYPLLEDNRLSRIKEATYLKIRIRNISGADIYAKRGLVILDGFILEYYSGIHLYDCTVRIESTVCTYLLIHPCEVQPII